MITRRAFATTLYGAGLALMSTAKAAAQAYPTRVVKLITPGAAGGPADVAAGLIARPLTADLGQSVIIENLPLGLKLAVQTIARAEPDGHTLLLANTSILATYPAVARQPEYDPVKDFTPVAGVFRTHQVLVVHPGVPAQTVQELIAYAQAHPGKLNFTAAGGFGALPHLAGALFKAHAGIQMVPVSYRGAAEAVTAIVGGQVDVAFESITILMPLVRDGKLRALAVTSAARNPLAPELPTLAESGVLDTVVTAFYGVVAPFGTATSVVNTLNAAINKSLALPEVRASLAKLGAEPMIGTPQEFGAFAASEAKKWSAVARSAGIQVD